MTNELTVAIPSDPSDSEDFAVGAGEVTRSQDARVIRETRMGLGLSQLEFAARFSIPVGTLRDWEQARAAPPAFAVAYVKSIAATHNGNAKFPVTLTAIGGDAQVAHGALSLGKLVSLDINRVGITLFHITTSTLDSWHNHRFTRDEEGNFARTGRNIASILTIVARKFSWIPNEISSFEPLENILRSLANENRFSLTISSHTLQDLLKKSDQDMRVWFQRNLRDETLE